MNSEQDNAIGAEGETLSPAETRRALWVAAIAWGVFGSAWMNMITGAPFVSFARSLGASTFMFGLLSSLPFLGVLAQLPASYVVERGRRRRGLFLRFASGQRLLWLVVAALPWAIPSDYPAARVGVFLALVVLSSTFGNAGTPAWMSWFADIVPENIRGRYLGNRAALGTVTAVITSASVGWILDRNSSYTVFTVIFSTAAVLGVIDIWLFLLVREPPMEKQEGPPWRLRNVVLSPLSNRPFRGYLLYAFSESMVFAIAGPFFWLMGLEVLEIGNLLSNLYIMIIPMVFTALTLPFWGGVCDRFGSKPLVGVGTGFVTVFPICWMMASPEQYHALLAVAAVAGGVFGAAIRVGDMNMLFALTPRRNRSAYIAMLSMAASLGWVIGPAAGGAIAQALRGVHVELAGMTFGNLHVLLLLSIVMRVVHVFLIVPRLPESDSQPSRALLRHLFVAPFLRFRGIFARPRR